MVYADGNEHLFAYDPNGNRTNLSATPPGGPTTVAGYSYDGADQLTSDVSLTNAYDASGNLGLGGERRVRLGLGGADGQRHDRNRDHELRLGRGRGADGHDQQRDDDAVGAGPGGRSS